MPVISKEIESYIPGIRGLIKASRFISYLMYLTRFGILEDNIQSVIDNDIRSLIGTRHSTTLITTDGGRLRGLLVASFLEWDTNYFGFPCYKINYLFSDSENNVSVDISIKDSMLRAFKAKARQEGGRLIMGRMTGSDLGSLWTLENEGFNMVDTLIVLGKSIGPPTKKTLPFPVQVVRNCPPKLLPKMKNAMTGAFGASRFILDYHFPSGSGEQMYVKWLEKVCQKDGQSDRPFVPVHSEEGHKGEQENLLVLQKGRDVAGFITYRSQKDIGRGSIELIVVHPSYRGMKVSDYLIGLVEDELRTEGINNLEVAAYLQNYSAINAYVRNSFAVISSIYTFHLWL